MKYIRKEQSISVKYIREGAEYLCEEYKGRSRVSL